MVSGDTSGTTRRNVLKVSGSLLGGIALGSSVVAAERTDRFIAETNGVDRSELEDAVDVVHWMGEVDLAVVEGAASDLEKVTRDFEADVEVELKDPVVNDDAPSVDEASPTDEPLFQLQWDKEDLDVETAHETTQGDGARVAIIDSGVSAGHPDLEGNVNEALSRNFTDDGFGAANAAGGYHGTHVGGIVAANDNGEGVIGTAPDAELVDCRVFTTEGGASFGDILAALVYSAAIGADAANLSLGAYPIPRQGLGPFYGKVLNRTMTYANARGTLLVLSAGNAAADLQHDKNLISLPNEGAQGLSVAATGPVGFGYDASEYGGNEPREAPAIYTNYGTNEIDLAAPGGNYSPAAADAGVPGWYFDLVLNTVATPQFRYEDVDDDGEEEPVELIGESYDYGWVAGTSMAAPQVAGAVALVKSENPGYNANQVEAALERAAEVPDGYDKSFYGSGYLNLVDAL